MPSSGHPYTNLKQVTRSTH